MWNIMNMRVLKIHLIHISSSILKFNVQNKLVHVSSNSSQLFFVSQLYSTLNHEENMRKTNITRWHQYILYSKYLLYQRCRSIVFKTGYIVYHYSNISCRIVVYYLISSPRRSRIVISHNKCIY